MADTARATARSELVSFAFALIGLGVSVYLTVEHYDSSVTLACPESSTINCAKVTTSRWSHIGPMPVALLGLIFFVVLAILTSPPAWRVRRLDAVRVGSAALGVASVVFLIWAELFQVNAICLWCTVVHVGSVGLLVAILWRVSALPPRSADQGD
jgi:uncharacterized membrane protein